MSDVQCILCRNAAAGVQPSGGVSRDAEDITQDIPVLGIIVPNI